RTRGHWTTVRWSRLHLFQNTTVYVGGINYGLCGSLSETAFQEFGIIHEVRIFKEKGYAFIRFDTHEAAAKAIVQRHGREVGGQACKCSWGKECGSKQGSWSDLFSGCCCCGGCGCGCGCF
uniref:RRM domain-containing protein n=1 Tax=Macrostomum lignano TaxID=282301 RepID=A0A1I8FHT6_9PLAT